MTYMMNEMLELVGLKECPVSGDCIPVEYDSKVTVDGMIELDLSKTSVHMFVEDRLYIEEPHFDSELSTFTFGKESVVAKTFAEATKKVFGTELVFDRDVTIYTKSRNLKKKYEENIFDMSK